MRISSLKMNLRESWDISILLSLKREHIEEIAVYCLYCDLAIKDYWEECPFIVCQDFWGLGFKQNKFCNLTFPCCGKVKGSHSVKMATWVLRYLPWAGWFTTKQIVIISFHVSWKINFLLDTKQYFIINHIKSPREQLLSTVSINFPSISSVSFFLRHQSQEWNNKFTFENKMKLFLT